VHGQEGEYGHAPFLKRYRSAADYAKASDAELEGADARGFSATTKSIKTASRNIAARRTGVRTMDELIALGGVGRKPRTLF
jgi:endonuclease III